MKRVRARVEVNLEELDQVLDQARQRPLSEPDCRKIKDTLHTLVGLLAPARNTEKTSTVLAQAVGAVGNQQSISDQRQTATPGHGRNGASAFNGARKIAIQHAKLNSGDRCPECEQGKCPPQKCRHEAHAASARSYS
jgi:transposase